MSHVLGWRRLGAVVSIMALLGLTLSAAGVASADEFTTANSAPTVSSPTLSASIQPDAGASDTVYSYSITVGDADTLNDLDTVTVCLYQTTDGDSTCGTPDPATDVELTWTQSTDTFTIVDGSDNDYWALGSSVSPTLTGTSGTFTFEFTVSEATREGDWTAAVTATDTSAANASDSTATTTVNHYSAITTRVSQDFGTLSAGATGSNSTASPTVTANGQTAYSMTAGDFTDGTYTFALKTTGLPSEGPAAGEVTFDCEVASTFTEGNSTRVGSTSTQLNGTYTTTGTGEGGSALDNTCRLAHGGERPASTYSATVVNAIGNG